MPSTIPIQTWAMIRRYLIYLYRRIICNILRIIIWPGIVIGIFFYILYTAADSSQDDFKKSVDLASGIPWVLSLLSFCIISHFSEWLVNDRATGFKSLMISMGLRRFSYYLGNSICFMALITPPVLIIIALTMKYIMVDSQAPTIAIICVFLLFNIHLTGILFVIASFITSSSYTSLVYLLLVLDMFGSHPLTVFVMGKASVAMQPLVLFIASLSPFESIRILGNSYRLCKNCDTTQLSESLVSQPIHLILIAMTFWSILAFAFARWFEEVCPWQSDTAVRSPFFCCAFKKQSSTNSREETSNSRFFEQPMANREIGIKINNLTKTYRNIPVVNDITFNIYKGETTLLLGHNGAGKTTLMDMVLGRLDPDGGQVLLTNSNRQVSNSKEGVGVCPQASILDDYLSVKQHLDLFADIKTSQMSSSELRDHIRTTIADVSLTSQMDKLPSELSGGMKRKLSLAMAFVGDSGILILDEPSSGLDPDSRVFVWNAIRRYRGDRTVLLSTQHMEEADYLGDRIAIMKEGKIICCGSSTFLNKLYGTGYKLRIECPASKKKQVLTFVKKYFAAAKPSENVQMVTPVNSQSKSDPIQDIVIELVDDKSSDSEINLIKMLEDIESNSNALHIKSHGLKSSSIEDVLLNTSKTPQSHEPNETVQLKLTSTSGHIATLAEPLRAPISGFLATQMSFLCAFIWKHIHSYKKDWITIIIYRILVPFFSIWSIVSEGLGTTEPVESPFAGFRPTVWPTFLVFHYMYYPVMERTTKFKTMQMTSSANFVVYWLAQILIEFISFIILAIGINLFLSTTFYGVFLESRFSVHAIATLAIIMMALSAALSIYILSFIFNDTKTCSGFYIILCSVSSILSFILLMIDLATRSSENIGKSKIGWLIDIKDKVFISTFPLDSFLYILYGLNKECYVGPPTKTFSKTCVKTNSFSPIYFGFIALVCQIFIFGSILYLIEKLNLDMTWYLRWKNIFCTKYKLFTGGMREIDEDVMTESSKATRLVTSVIPRETYSMVASDLSKSYVAGLKAVDHLSFTVHRGECFGLLGVNGAGKSTTFSMLVAESRPDSGRIWVNGHYSTEDVTNYRQSLGYDPQENPMMSLSSVDALFLMARLRKIHEQSIPMVVNSILELLAMTEHAYKPAKDLSGGTKRKLALGMSLIGSPALLALDEPTAGVDPIARRSIWQLLRSLRMQNGASIVISSHAMEECEAICDRISIMARGRLRCIGTFLSLRNKFSQGCSIRVHFSSKSTGHHAADEIKKLVSTINERLQAELASSVKLSDTNASSATFNVSDDRVKRSKIFKVLRDLKQKHPQISYLVNDSSLEDIFIALAREQQEFELTNSMQMA